MTRPREGSWGPFFCFKIFVGFDFWVVLITCPVSVGATKCVCRPADPIETYLFVFLVRFVVSLRRSTSVEQAPWHRRDVVALPAGRQPRRGSRPSVAGSPSAVARRRRPRSASPAGGGAGVPRRVTTSKSPYGRVSQSFWFSVE